MNERRKKFLRSSRHKREKEKKTRGWRSCAKFCRVKSLYREVADSKVTRVRRDAAPDEEGLFSKDLVGKTGEKKRVKTRCSLVLISFPPFRVAFSRDGEGGPAKRAVKIDREEREKGERNEKGRRKRLFMPAPSRLKRRGVINYLPKSCNDPGTNRGWFRKSVERGEKSAASRACQSVEKNYRRRSRGEELRLHPLSLSLSLSLSLFLFRKKKSLESTNREWKLSEYNDVSSGFY